MRFGWAGLFLFAAATASLAAADVRGQLVKTRVDVDWEKQPATIGEAVEHLAKQTGVKTTLSAKAADAKAEVKVGLNAKGDSAKVALDKITETHDLAWRIREEAVELILRSEITVEPVVYFYDVSDILDAEPEGEDAKTLDDIIEEISKNVVPWSWEEIEGSHLRPRKKVIVAVAIPDVQREIDAFLAELQP